MFPVTGGVEPDGVEAEGVEGGKVLIPLANPPGVRPEMPAAGVETGSEEGTTTALAWVTTAPTEGAPGWAVK